MCNLSFIAILSLLLVTYVPTSSYAYQINKQRILSASAASAASSSPRRKEQSKPSGNDTPRHLSRNQFLLATLATTTATLSINPFTENSSTIVNAFEGGVGGLGKTKPQTGVVFANPDLEDITTLTIPGDYNAELLAPDGETPVFLSFYAQWPMLKSAGIESRDLANAESSFVQVAPYPSGYSVGDTLKKPFFVESIFGQTGKYGAYGTPSDIKVSKVPESKNGDLYQVSFVTLTPAMRESDRKAYIATKAVGGGIFMLVVGTTLTRFKSQEKTLRKIADSFECIEAPKSKMNRR